jgi:hypothetical protein
VKWFRRLRDIPGVMLRDLPRYRRQLDARKSGPSGWLKLGNRGDRLLAPQADYGVRCDWSDGTALHAPLVWPSLGRWLMQRALAQWPIGLAPNGPAAQGEALPAHVPELTFVFAHAGMARVPQLLTTIRSLQAMADCRLEIVVVDQGAEPVGAFLPEGVRYQHLDTRQLTPGWYKSWAYNVGARMALAPRLVFHDGDICVPRAYARELKRVFELGFDVASLQRFLFYLGQNEVPTALLDGEWIPAHAPTLVYQHWKGGTIAILREAFFSIGGFDEGFVDWGGEDDEFFDRCGSLRHCRDAYLPFLHLWHAPQADRRQTENPNITTVLPQRLAMPPAMRIAELQARGFGDPSGPGMQAGYKAAGSTDRIDVT